jgi:hypothetical protein
MPANDAGRSTVATTNPVEELGDLEIALVPVQRIDDYSFGDHDGFVKIDVEGHEEAVL